MTLTIPNFQNWSFRLTNKLKITILEVHMNRKYLVLDSLLKDNFAAAINSYESLPINYKQQRSSSDILITSNNETDDEKYESDEEYPYMTINKINKKLTRDD
jgi:hypothetical protein